MKKKYLLLALLLTSVFGRVTSQNPNFIKQTDTLQDGSVLITLLLQDSTFVKRYLAVNPVDTGLLFKNILTSFPPSDQSNPERDILYTGNHGIATSSKITCPYTRTMDTPWQWLSYPRLQRTGNGPVVAIPVLEDLSPIPDELFFRSNEGGLIQEIERLYGIW